MVADLDILKVLEYLIALQLTKNKRLWSQYLTEAQYKALKGYHLLKWTDWLVFIEGGPNVSAISSRPGSMSIRGERNSIHSLSATNNNSDRKLTPISPINNSNSQRASSISVPPAPSPISISTSSYPIYSAAEAPAQSPFPITGLDWLRACVQIMVKEQLIPYLCERGDYPRAWIKVDWKQIFDQLELVIKQFYEQMLDGSRKDAVNDTLSDVIEKVVILSGGEKEEKDEKTGPEQSSTVGMQRNRSSKGSIIHKGSKDFNSVTSTSAFNLLKNDEMLLKLSERNQANEAIIIDDMYYTLEEDAKDVEAELKKSFTVAINIDPNGVATSSIQDVGDEVEKGGEKLVKSTLATSSSSTALPTLEEGRSRSSFTNFSSTTSSSLKYLLAEVDKKTSGKLNKDLKAMLFDAKPSRSKWANDERIGQEELYEALEKVLYELKTYTEHSYPFLTKVSKRDVPDYYDIIKNPMDLGTMTRNLKSLHYKSKDHFVRDLNLIYTNCFTYNTAEESIYRLHARAMKEKSDKLLANVPNIVIRSRNEESSNSNNNFDNNDDAMSISVFNDEEDDESASQIKQQVRTNTTAAPSVDGESYRETEFDDEEEEEEEDDDAEEDNNNITNDQEEDEHAIESGVANEKNATDENQTSENGNGNNDSLAAEDDLSAPLDPENIVDIQVRAFRELTTVERLSHLVYRRKLFDKLISHKLKLSSSDTMDNNNNNGDSQFSQSPVRWERKKSEMKRYFDLLRSLYSSPSNILQRKKKKTSSNSNCEPVDHILLQASFGRGGSSNLQQQQKAAQQSSTSAVGRTYFLPEFQFIMNSVPESVLLERRCDAEDIPVGASDTPTSNNSLPSLSSLKEGKPHKRAHELIMENIQAIRDIHLLKAKLDHFMNNSSTTLEGGFEDDYEDAEGQERPLLPFDYEEDTKPSSAASPYLTQEIAFSSLQYFCSALLMHVGFDGASKLALDAFTEIVREHFVTLSRSFKVYHDEFSRTKSFEEILRLALHENGSYSHRNGGHPLTLESVKEYYDSGIIRYGGKLREIKRRLECKYKDLIEEEAILLAAEEAEGADNNSNGGGGDEALEDEPEDGDVAFLTGFGDDSLVGGVGVDFLGLKEMGLGVTQVPIDLLLDSSEKRRMMEKQRKARQRRELLLKRKRLRAGNEDGKVSSLNGAGEAESSSANPTGQLNGEESEQEYFDRKYQQTFNQILCSSSLDPTSNNVASTTTTTGPSSSIVSGGVGGVIMPPPLGSTISNGRIRSSSSLFPRLDIGSVQRHIGLIQPVLKKKLQQVIVLAQQRIILEAQQAAAVAASAANNNININSNSGNAPESSANSGLDQTSSSNGSIAKYSSTNLPPPHSTSSAPVPVPAPPAVPLPTLNPDDIFIAEEDLYKVQRFETSTRKTGGGSKKVSSAAVVVTSSSSNATPATTTTR